jgi:hypothetical protein
VLQPRAVRLVYAHFLVVQGAEFALQALHLGDHGVEGCERRIGGGGFGGGFRGRGEGGEDVFGAVFDVALGRLLVAAGELVGHAEEGLVLEEEGCLLVNEDLRVCGVESAYEE